ncbi:MAG: hypothetical protein J5995_10075 [Muribaculaceae bacterium]|nr:hypothetical protein [Muribaculaceae bacterium]
MSEPALSRLPEAPAEDCGERLAGCQKVHLREVSHRLRFFRHRRKPSGRVSRK